MSEAHRLKLLRDRTLVLVVDMQERLAAAMPPARLQEATRATVVLVEGAKAMGVPVLCTEQYPQGLGPTIQAVRASLPAQVEPLPKRSFSCVGASSVAEAIKAFGRPQVVICGMESHVCVYQTARDLVASGHDVFVTSDAVLSRLESNRAIGLGLMERAGAALSSAEAILFDLAGTAADPAFKLVSRLVR